MATYTVEPLPDGVSQRGNWQVTKNNRVRVSSHVKKSAAKRRARREANNEDSVRVKDVRGQYLR